MGENIKQGGRRDGGKKTVEGRKRRGEWDLGRVERSKRGMAVSEREEGRTRENEKERGKGGRKDGRK